MYKRVLRKRILKGLVIALALFAVMPVTNAAARAVSPSDNPYPRPVLRQSQLRPTAAERRVEGLRGQALNQKYLGTKYHRGTYSIYDRAVNASSGNDLSWSEAGVGVGILAALLFGTAAAALTARNRHHEGLAH